VKLEIWRREDWRFGDLEISRFDDLGWRFGDLEIWRFALFRDFGFSRFLNFEILDLGDLGFDDPGIR
jgi:hypothetical protein